jgi:malonate-semialdehyde dehydrogenase (acetylating)/methylmalonate-semialdehyde dehydrogenase
MLRLARPSSLRLPILTRSYAQPALASQSSEKKSGLSPLAQQAAEEVSSKWRGTSATGGKTKNYIGGEFVESKAEKWLDVLDPVSLP